MLTEDYEERVYAGVLGKIIGVYLGRPFEGWSNERIERELGEIDHYVHDKVGVPLIVTDDDISGTFTFVRAFEDYGYDPQLSPAQIGRTWLNYLIEDRTILWWGGMGNSTEHTAYLRLKDGIEAPHSGSIEQNGQVVAEQIGAQIFIDGWAMINPGDPERAADFARRAASVSHDGVAVHGAQVLAAMEAQAFVESDIDALIDCGVAQIPSDSLLRTVIDDVREWSAKNGDDWRATLAQIQKQYGYDQYGGNVHMVPNHALIIQALLHGAGDFQRSLMIVNTSGWDTDCNSGNLGCLLGIRNGVAGFDSGPDWRGPVADTCYMPSSDPGRGVTDAVAEAAHIIDMGRRLAGAEPYAPKDGARFHFSFPGSVQGFRGVGCLVNNFVARSGEPCLAVHFDPIAENEPARATTPVFIDSIDTAKYFEGRGYGLMASPSVNPGQTLTAAVEVDRDLEDEVEIALCIRVFDPNDHLVTLRGPSTTLAPGEDARLEWRIPDVDGYPIAEIGIDILTAPSGGALYIDRVDVQGAPEVMLTRREGSMWHRAWVNGVDSYRARRPETFRLIQNRGQGLLLYGNRDWTDYRVTADVTPHMAKRVGVTVRTQGMGRFYALALDSAGRAEIVRELDGRTVLAEIPWSVEFYRTYELSLAVEGNRLVGRIDGEAVLDAEDDALTNGGIALLIEEGRTTTNRVTVGPV